MQNFLIIEYNVSWIFSIFLKAISLKWMYIQYTYTRLGTRVMSVFMYMCVCKCKTHIYQSWKDCVWTLKHLIRFYWICCFFLSGWPIYLSLGCFYLKSLSFSPRGKWRWCFPLKSKKLVLPRFSFEIRKLKIKYLQFWGHDVCPVSLTISLWHSESSQDIFTKMEMEKKVHKSLAWTGKVLGE